MLDTMRTSNEQTRKCSELLLLLGQVCVHAAVNLVYCSLSSLFVLCDIWVCPYYVPHPITSDPLQSLFVLLFPLNSSMAKLSLLSPHPPTPSSSPFLPAHTLLLSPHPPTPSSSPLTRPHPPPLPSPAHTLLLSPHPPTPSSSPLTRPHPPPLPSPAHTLLLSPHLPTPSSSPLTRPHPPPLPSTHPIIISFAVCLD